MKKVILFLVGIVFFLYGCTQSNINVIQKVESPNGKYVAYAHVRNGGATTSFTPFPVSELGTFDSWKILHS